MINLTAHLQCDVCHRDSDLALVGGQARIWRELRPAVAAAEGFKQYLNKDLCPSCFKTIQDRLSDASLLGKNYREARGSKL